jgi:hypothetical protein
MAKTANEEERAIRHKPPDSIAKTEQLTHFCIRFLDRRFWRMPRPNDGKAAVAGDPANPAPKI